MNSDDEAAFREFVGVQLDQLRGLAYLTCGDWHLAEDAVCTVLAKLYARWRKVDRTTVPTDDADLREFVSRDLDGHALSIVLTAARTTIVRAYASGRSTLRQRA